MSEPDRMTMRIESFLSDPDAGMLAGERRMTPEKLMDMLADRIMRDGPVNIIRIRAKKDLSDLLASGGRVAVKHILIYADLSIDETKDIISMFRNAQIYKAKELCHQLPVCYRESADMCDLACRRE